VAGHRERSGFNVHERSGNATTTQNHGEKNGRSEERPSSGRKRPGRAAASQSRIAIPRCSNMNKSRLVGKAQSIIILDKTPQKPWKNRHNCLNFDPSAVSFSTCAMQQMGDFVNVAVSSHRRRHATKDSREGVIPSQERLETQDG
jgi:hypothetical protein